MATSKTSRTDHVHKNFIFFMGQISRQWRRVIDKRLQPLGLTEATWLPLLHLARASEPMRQKDLAASLFLDSSSVVRLLDGLQSAGFIERCEGADRRAKTVHLTPLGKTTVKRVEELVSEGRNALLACVPEDELEKAFAVIERIADAVSSVARDELV